MRTTSTPTTAALLFGAAALPLLLAADCDTPADDFLSPPLDCVAVSGLPGLQDGSLTNPFPSMHLMAETGAGCRVRIPGDALPVGTDSDPLDTARFDRLDGFSLVQTSYWRPSVAIDPQSLPRWDDPSGGLGGQASVQLWDLDRGLRLPAFAEVDAYPQQSDEQRALLVRPLAPMPESSHVAVVVTDAVRGLDGQPLASPAELARIRGLEPGAELRGADQHYQALLAALEPLGVARGSVVMAWDFRTASRASLTAPLDRVVSQMREELPVTPDFAPPVSIDALLDADDGGPNPPLGIWRELRGSVAITHYLWAEDPEASPEEHDRGSFSLDEEGLPLPRDVAPAYFIAVVPDSVRGAAPGSVPVVVFGHGIFSSPRAYLTSPTDESATIELLNRLGAIGIGGEWRGLTERDRPDAIRVATNLGRFPLLTDKMVQGVSNQLALPRLLRTAFAQQEAFAHPDGGSLIDPSRVHYFGISLGGIEGLTLMALTEEVEYGVLHVPGSTWSTMLERSTNWNSFEPFVIEHMDAPWDRQLIYAVSQLLWDAVDPATHADSLRDRSVLMQVSVGDEQVPNFTAESVARAAGLGLATPSVHDVAGLEALTLPLPPSSAAYMQFDSGAAAPPTGNRPALGSTGAHTSIRHSEEVMSQIEAFFAEGSEGSVIDPCDGAPCTLDLVP